MIDQSIFLGNIAGGLLENSNYLKLMLQDYSSINNNKIINSFIDDKGRITLNDFCLNLYLFKYINNI